MVAIYLRKSRGDIEDLNKHKETLIELCNNNSWKYDLYEEIGSSATLERPELSKLLSNINNYTKVVVMALDRLSREELGQATITNLFRENNIEVVTPTKIYNFNKEQDTLMSDFEKLLARQEFRLIKKRLVTGKIQSFKQGNWVQGFAPMPYVYNRDTKSLDIDKEKFEVFERIKELALKGYSAQIIACDVNMKVITIRRLLKNKTLLGYVKYKGEYVKGNHEPVLTLEEWNIIQNYIKGRTNGITRTRHHYPLTGLVKCNCGHSRSSVRRKDRNNKEIIAKCRYCNDSSMLSDNIHQKIKEELNVEIDRITFGFNSNDNKNKIKSLNKELKLINTNIKKENKKLDKLKEMVLNDIITLIEGKELTNKSKNIIKDLQERKNLIEHDLNNMTVNKKEMCENLKMVNEVLKNNLQDEEINNLYKIIIDRIIIKNKKVNSIVFK
ncbi:TPA: recombinase family protein [Clostridium perfringens]|uniref:recombinase family protein n=2 Tax=Clostridium perfringens TaxID=1502 RepID=UPI001CB49A79|nr:recombinase family protein [Clostridium perfringens]EJT5935629.1 recombinase family protein [Clostridium perfringens]ELC8402025.1 recombinase family protein [Clostridium perfringens]MDH5094922.1 hypothetical protein [Clostridium perfringens]MDM0883913.1 recombinase family protein [Clostridium perfringens]HBI6988857.1 recombinase family protein [Clostridium perfringens]